MTPTSFEWDEQKNRSNQSKHGVSFDEAQYAFADPKRVIAQDKAHGGSEERFYCFGRVGEGVMTVRFTHRAGRIRILGAGWWRKGRRIHKRR